MKKNITIIICTLFLFQSFLYADSKKFTFNNGTEVYYNSIKGPSKISSFLTKGFNFSQNLSLLVSKNQENLTQRFYINARGTNDDRVNPDDVSMETFYYLCQWNNAEVRFGDVLGSLSSYSLNRGLKGVMFNHNDIFGFKIISTAGTPKTKWKDMWEEDKTAVKDVFVKGIGIEREIGGVLNLGINTVNTDESNENNSTVRTSDNTVLAYILNFYPVSNIRANMEIANSKDRLNSTGSTVTGTAQNYDVYVRKGITRTKVGYEKVDPNFKTLSGSASTDKEKVYGDISLKPGKGIKLRYKQTNYHNNLSADSSINTAQTNITQINASKKGILKRKNLKLAVKQIIRAYEQKENDRDTLSSIITVSDKIKRYTITSSYENRSTNDKSISNNDKQQDIFSVNIGSKYRFKKNKIFMFRPIFRYIVNENIKNSTTNKTFSTGINLSLNLNRKFIFSGIYNYSDYTRDAADDQTITLININCRYIPQKNSDTTLNIGFKTNINEYATNTKNYTEDIFSITLSKKF